MAAVVVISGVVTYRGLFFSAMAALSSARLREADGAQVS
jgi:hypothetical protein